ncbi:Hemicentin-2, partial [Geodia barretti]
DWQDLELTVDGSLLSGSGSFVESLSEVVTNKLRMLAESANSRRGVAQMSLDQSGKRLLAVEDQYNEAVANVSLAEQRRNSANERVNEATMRLQQVERQFNDSRDELQELVDIDKRCTEEVCRDVCMPGEVCRNCSMPTFIEKTVENCTVQIYNSSVPSTCCENVTCAARVPDPSCVRNNADCRAMRQREAGDAQGVGDEARELFQQLVEARRNRSLAQTAKRRAGVEYEIYKQRVDQLAMSLERLQKARDNSETVYDRTLEEVEPILRIYESGNDSGYQNVFSINGVTFNTKLTNSPTSLAFNVVFQNLIDNSGTEYRESYLYISTQSEAVNLERMADGIIDTAFIGDSKRSTWLQTRLRRQTTTDLTPRQIFASRCTHISNTQLFFAEIQARLTEIQENINTSREGAGGLSESLSEDGPQEDEEFAAYLDLIRDYEDLSMEALRALESTIFSEWQASMEFLYSESGSVGEVGCDGLADCLQTSTDQLLNLIDLTPDSQLSLEFISLRPSFPLAAKRLLELALLSNVSIQEGLARVDPIIEITTAYATDNYWCNEPPVMITEPPPEVNISLGATLRLSCEAESNLPLTYYWMRGGNVLPQFTTNELVLAAVQRQDSANYTCVASNPVGTAESIDTSVTVYELPQFYLSPESVVTYFGDGNGAWFACNASAWPYPGWRWYHRSSPESDWTIVEGELTNELLIVDPQVEDEGMYACEAFNYHGSVRSEPVTLTLLPFTVSQHQFPLEFSVFISNGTCTAEDLYDSLYS